MSDKIDSLTQNIEDFFDKKEICDKVLQKQFIPGLSAVLAAMSLTKPRIVYISSSQSAKKFSSNIVVFISEYYAPMDTNLEDAVREDEEALTQNLLQFGKIETLSIDVKTGYLSFLISVDIPELEKEEVNPEAQLSVSTFAKSREDADLETEDFSDDTEEVDGEDDFEEEEVDTSGSDDFEKDTSKKDDLEVTDY